MLSTSPVARVFSWLARRRRPRPLNTSPTRDDYEVIECPELTSRRDDFKLNLEKAVYALKIRGESIEKVKICCIAPYSACEGDMIMGLKFKNMILEALESHGLSLRS